MPQVIVNSFVPQVIAEYDRDDSENQMFMHEYTFGARAPDSLIGESIFPEGAETTKSFATHATAGGGKQSGYRPVSMLESTVTSQRAHGLSSIRSEGGRPSDEGLPNVRPSHSLPSLALPPVPRTPSGMQTQPVSVAPVLMMVLCVCVR